MKRDLDLLRTVLLAMEADDFEPGATLALDGYTEDVVGYHVYLLADAGLLVGDSAGHMGTPMPFWMPRHLTFAGHDFLDAARNDEAWRKVTGAAGRTVGTMALDVVKSTLGALATDVLQRQLGLRP